VVEPPIVSARGRFAAAGAWAFVIVSTVPIGPRLTGSLIERINSIAGTDHGGDYLAGTVGCLLAAGLLAALVRILRHPAIRTPRNLVALLVSSAAYVGIYRAMDNPGEKIHFLEYGVLAILLLCAWREVVISRMIWPFIVLPAFMLGIADEWVQYLTPWFRSLSPGMRELVSQRFGEFHDVCWNLASVALPTFILSIFEPVRDAPARPREVAAARALAVGFLAFFCGFLLVTQEYGVLIEDPRGYSFRTRMAGPEALVAADAAPPPALAGELALQGPFNYDTFQQNHPASADPRVNEFRVHLFRRNRYLGYFAHALARRSQAGLDSAPPEGAFPEMARALREYILDYDAAWLLETHGDAIRSDAEWERRFAGWIRGETHAWGDSLLAHYLERHGEKIQAGEIPTIVAALDDLRIAEREDRILEDYFPRLLFGSGYGWSSEFRDEVDLLLVEGPDPEEYESAVANRIFTGYSPAGILGMSFCGILAVLAWPLGSAVRGRRALGAALLVLDAAALLLLPRLTPPLKPSVDVLARSRPVAIARHSDGPRAVSGNVASDASRGTWFPLRATSAGETVAAAAAVAFMTDAHSLTVAFRCDDTRVIATLRERDANLWREDAFELFIDTEGWGRHYVEIEVSPLGTLYDAHVVLRRSIDFAASKAATLAGLEARADTTPGGWQAVLSVPWATLGLSGTPDFLRVNACRVDADGSRRSYQAWSPTLGWFHRPGRFGMLVPESTNRSRPK
jgi:hypothetical protein